MLEDDCDGGAQATLPAGKDRDVHVSDATAFTHYLHQPRIVDSSTHTPVMAGHGVAMLLLAAIGLLLWWMFTHKR